MASGHGFTIPIPEPVKGKKRGCNIPLEQVPRIYSIMKWVCLVVIAVSTASVGFFQSMLVSWLYELRSTFINKVVQGDAGMLLKFFQYTLFNLILAFLCCLSLYFISPAGSGSGIPDVKAFLNGVESPIFKNFFRIRTFISKVIGSALAVSASLIMGKEGPMLHAGSILAVILGSNKWMQQQMEVAAHWGVYTYNKELRDLVAVGAACGVTTAFKAPVGGVLFAMEMSTRWRQELTWKAFLACATSLVVIRLLNKACNDHEGNRCSIVKWGSLIWFQMGSMPTPYQQVLAVIVLALIMGYLGSLFTSFNTWVCLVRKKWAKHMWLKIAEVCAISVATSFVFFVLPSMGRCKTCKDIKMVNGEEYCTTGGSYFHLFSWWHCSGSQHYNDLAVLVFNPQGSMISALFQADKSNFAISSLVLYSIFYWLMAAITYGAFIPSGLFTPSLIFGGCMGRIFANILASMHIINNADVGMYALLGAAGFLGGLMRMSAAQALILMEMTQAPGQLPFLMLTLVLAKNVGDHFNYSVFDHQMMLKGLQFVGIDDNKAQKSKLKARDVMTSNNRDRTLYAVESGSVLQQILDLHKTLEAFPVTTIPETEDQAGNFLGMISRENVKALLDENGPGCDKIDLRTKIEVAPIIIPTNMPLPFIYRVVNAEGFNYVPVIKYHGPLEGIVSRTELVEIQDKKLDEFHLKDTIAKMSDDLEQGKLIGSMNLTGNIHAAKFKEFFSNPLAATKEALTKDDKPEEEQRTFFLEDEDLPDASTSQHHRAMRAGSTSVRRNLPSESGAEIVSAGSHHNTRHTEVEATDADLERQPLTGGHQASSGRGDGAV